MVIRVKFNMFKLDVKRPVVKVQVPPVPEFTDQLRGHPDPVLHRIRAGVNGIGAQRGAQRAVLHGAAEENKKSSDLIAALSAVNTGQRVTVLTGYDQTDI
jgi:hypothetical protein